MPGVILAMHSTETRAQLKALQGPRTLEGTPAQLSCSRKEEHTHEVGETPTVPPVSWGLKVGFLPQEAGETLTLCNRPLPPQPSVFFSTNGVCTNSFATSLKVPGARLGNLCFFHLGCPSTRWLINHLYLQCCALHTYSGNVHHHAPKHVAW